MTVAVQQRRVQYAGDGATTLFAVPYRFAAPGDLLVLRVAGGVETHMQLNVHYTVMGGGDAPSGTVIFNAPPAAGSGIVILRQTARTQETTYVPNDPFPAKVHEAAIDKLTMIAQEMGDELARAVLVPESDPQRGAMVLPPASERAGQFLAFGAAGQPVAATGGGGDSGLRSDLAADDGAALIGFAPGFTIIDSLRTCRDVREFGVVLNSTGDQWSKLQTAIDESYGENKDLYLPSAFYHSGDKLVIPTAPETRGRAWHLRGQGVGEPFVSDKSGGGTWIIGEDNHHVLGDAVPQILPQSSGTIEISGIRFQSAPSSDRSVVRFEALYGLSHIHDCVFYQAGTGHGLGVNWTATAEINRNYFLNRDWATEGLGAARTGFGCAVFNPYDAGLFKVRGNTSRGFSTGFAFQAEVGRLNHSAIFESNECSYVRNGYMIDNATNTSIMDAYVEGVDGGTGIILNNAHYTKIHNLWMFSGFSVGIDAAGDTAPQISGCSLFLGEAANVVGIRLSGTGKGGRYQVARDNVIGIGGGANQVAFDILGADASLDLFPNTIVPATDPAKVLRHAPGAVLRGNLPLAQPSGGLATAYMQSAISLAMAARTEANVVGGVLDVSDRFSAYNVSPSTATTISSLNLGGLTGRLIILRLNGNATLQHGANISLQGSADITGPATVMLLSHNGTQVEQI